jgi:hypothetical protein
LAIRVKVVCKSVLERQGPNHPLFDATLYPVNNCPENTKVFRNGIPGGQLQLMGLEEKCFETGKHYWVDVSEAPSRD